jgi:hypothetical protein
MIKNKFSFTSQLMLGLITGSKFWEGKWPSLRAKSVNISIPFQNICRVFKCQPCRPSLSFHILYYFFAYMHINKFTCLFCYWSVVLLLKAQILNLQKKSLNIGMSFQLEWTIPSYNAVRENVEIPGKYYWCMIRSSKVMPLVGIKF